MSARASGRVWEFSRHKGSELLVLLAIADHANDDGANSWPSIKTLADKTRLSERAVRYVIRKLQESGELTCEESASPKGTNLYHIHLGGAKIAGGQSDGGLQNHAAPPAKSRRSGGQNHADPPAIAVAPEPSLNQPLTVQEPSGAPAREDVHIPFLMTGPQLAFAIRHGFTVKQAHELARSIVAAGVATGDVEREWRRRIEAHRAREPPHVAAD